MSTYSSDKRKTFYEYHQYDLPSDLISLDVMGNKSSQWQEMTLSNKSKECISGYIRYHISHNTVELEVRENDYKTLKDNSYV